MASPFPKICAAAKKAGFFILKNRGSRWEFLSSTTGRLVLTWWACDGNWTTPGGKRGNARDALTAIALAKEIESRN